VAFCAPDEMGELKAIQKVMGISIPVASGRPWAAMDAPAPAKPKPSGGGRRRSAPKGGGAGHGAGHGAERGASQGKPGGGRRRRRGPGKARSAA
jgi:ATP-dependent RNA helicase RhlE